MAAAPSRQKEQRLLRETGSQTGEAGPARLRGRPSANQTSAPTARVAQSGGPKALRVLVVLARGLPSPRGVNDSLRETHRCGEGQESAEYRLAGEQHAESNTASRKWSDEEPNEDPPG